MIFRDISYLAEDFTVRRGNVVTRGDTIEYIGGDLPEGDFGEVISGADRLLLPGLVNAHCHVPMTLLRGYGEGLPLQRWLNEKVFPFEDKLTAEDVYWGSLVGIAEMLASGVTSFSEMYSFCEDICEAVRISGIKTNISRGIVSFDGSGLFGSERHDESEHLIDSWNGMAHGRIITEVCIHAEYTSNERLVREQAMFAKACGVGIHLHLSETRSEHDECVAKRGITPAKYFEECGIFESRVTAAHCVHITDADMDILARNGVTVVHNPTSNLKLGSGIAPVPRMFAAGVNVALGTDGASSNNNLNMFEEMHLAALIHRGVAENPELMAAKEVIAMATTNGAKAQGRDDIGIIKVGNKADFAVISLNKSHSVPNHDLISSVVFAAQASDVEMTVVDGKVLYRNGEFITFDVEEAKQKAKKAAARIAAEL
jgi:5-methylthioadenosine/S-adenosylhomocysteine deaminase